MQPLKVRKQFTLSSQFVMQLKPGARVHILAVRTTQDNLRRACIALEGQARPVGWISTGKDFDPSDPSEDLDPPKPANFIGAAQRRSLRWDPKEQAQAQASRTVREVKESHEEKTPEEELQSSSELQVPHLCCPCAVSRSALSLHICLHLVALIELGYVCARYRGWPLLCCRVR
jgi:hypothetical protein